MSNQTEKPSRPRRRSRSRRRSSGQPSPDGQGPDNAQRNGKEPGEKSSQGGGGGRRRRSSSSRRSSGGGEGEARNESGQGQSQGQGQGQGQGQKQGRRQGQKQGQGGQSGQSGQGQKSSSQGGGNRRSKTRSAGGGNSSNSNSNSNKKQRSRQRGPQGNQRGQRQRRRGGKPGGSRTQRLKQMFDQLHTTVSIDPEERWELSRDDESFTTRVIDLVAPIGKGQRCLIVAPPKAGKTTLLLEIAKSLEINHPEAKVFALLVDERPEEVTNFRRNCHAEVIAASSDQVAKEHVKVVEEGLGQVLEPVLEGEDVVLLLDSITRLARAYNVVKGDSGRTLSGGLDANTMQMPRRIFGAARNIEGGGSLTILGTALVDTGSRMDEVIFQEFKGTGNTEIVLSRQLFEKRIFPAVDIGKSGTRKEEKLYDPSIVDLIFKVRRVLAGMPPDRAMDGLLKLMGKHPTNEALLRALPQGR